MSRVHRVNRQQGFSLIEALIALALVGLTMTIGMSLMAQQSDVNRQMRAHLDATRAIETTLEDLRAGVVPLVTGEVGASSLPEGEENQEGEELSIWLEVEPRLHPPGLTEVVVEARYLIGTRPHRRQIRTMVWSAQ